CMNGRRRRVSRGEAVVLRRRAVSDCPENQRIILACGDVDSTSVCFKKKQLTSCAVKPMLVVAAAVLERGLPWTELSPLRGRVSTVGIDAVLSQMTKREIFRHGQTLRIASPSEK